MLVVLGLVPIFIVIAIVWPIVAIAKIAKQQEAQSGYSFTACMAAWYAQIMAMVGIVVFTIGIGYLFKSLIGYLNLGFSYGPLSSPLLGQDGPTTVASLEQQRQVDLLVRTPSFMVAGPIIYFVHAYLSRTVSAQRLRAPYWVMRGSQLVQTIFLGTVSTVSSLLALNLVLGYLLIFPLGNQPRASFGEMLGFALAFMGAFVAHVVIWRRYPGGSWWSPPNVWPPTRQASHDSAKSRERQLEGSAPLH
jgi:hypothetical protein